MIMQHSVIEISSIVALFTHLQHHTFELTYIGSYIQHASASNTKNILIIHTFIYLYIYIHQSRPYQHLRTRNHPFVIILLRNSNNQSCVTYITSYCPPNQISTVHSEELHVMDYLSKFLLNRIVNKPGNAVLRQLRRPGKSVAPGAVKAAPDDTCSVKTQKTAFFVNRTPLLLPGGSSLLPGGTYSSGKIPDFSHTHEEP